MKVRKFIAVAASIFTLSACGTPPKPAPQAVTPAKFNFNDPGDVAAASSVKLDEYGTSTIYRGPNVASKPGDQLFIRAQKTDAGAVTYQIYFVINYSGVWRFYNWAYDTNGNTLNLMLVSRNLAPCQSNNCSHNEHLSIDVTPKYLEENRHLGLHFWVSGKAADEEVLFIPAGYIKAFLSLSDQSR